MGVPICGACRRPIEGRVVNAMGKQWHVEVKLLCTLVSVNRFGLEKARLENGVFIRLLYLVMDKLSVTSATSESVRSIAEVCVRMPEGHMCWCHPLHHKPPPKQRVMKVQAFE